MEQLILAVDLMHQNKIIHRDIKPDNVLLIDKKQLKICISDLGLACDADDSGKIRIKCGSPWICMALKF
jgi:serine/threonine protein kinase